MRSFDELLRMTDAERDRYLRAEVERVITSARPCHVLKLRALQAHLDGIRHKIKHPLVAAEMMYGEMIYKVHELNDYLRGIRK